MSIVESTLSVSGRRTASELETLRERYLPRALTALAPSLVTSAEGVRVRALDGREYLDFTGGWGCLAVGHSHPRVVRAIQDQAALFAHTDASVIQYEVYLRLAERLAEAAPGPSPKKAAFFNSGAEALENAVKIARAATGRGGVVVFEGAFHGRTLLALTMTHKAPPYKRGFGPLASEVYRMPLPNPYRRPMRFEDWERDLRLLVSLDTVAAVVLEPVQGEGGFVVPQEGFLPYLRDLTRRHGIALVLDEVQSGMGRTGKLYAHEHFGIEADLVALAKSLAAGMPLSAVVGVASVMDAVGDSGIGGTYVGNPVCCAAALAVLDVIEDEGLLERARHLGRRLQDRFAEFASRHPSIGDVRGLGAMTAIELVRDRATKEPASEETARVIAGALDEQLLLAKAGLYGNVIRLVISDADLDEGLRRLDRALSRASARP
jgi:4-aminobutyrate aminotransferase/(S)-3-amino-2-methylpropionate transaminase